MILHPFVLGIFALGIFPLASTASNYIVQLKPEATLSQLLDVYNNLQIQNIPSPVNTVTIGDNFKCFFADLDDSSFKTLKSNSFVYDITPNLYFKVYENGNFEVLPEDFGINSVEDSDSKNDEHENEVLEIDEEITEINEQDEENKTEIQSQNFIGTFGEEKIGESVNNSNDGEHVITQFNAPSHLARLSSIGPLTNDTNTELGYYYGSTGKEVVAYVVDNGVAIDHPEFEGRASVGKSFVNDGKGIGDHGTHVAGIIGSKTYGVAKDVTIVDVQVLSKFGYGLFSDIIEGIEFISKDRQKRGVKGVANMSFGGVYSGAINDACTAAVGTGIVIVAAAGNEGMSSNWVSPASAEGVITVGAIDDSTDKVAAFSNYGPKVDVFASGVNVSSLNSYDFEKPVKFSGTSMACPVITGLVATFLEEEVPAYHMVDKIVETSSKDSINFGDTWAKRFARRNTPNRIAYNTYGVESDSDSSVDQIKGTKLYHELFEQEIAWEWAKKSAEIRGIHLAGPTLA